MSGNQESRYEWMRRRQAAKEPQAVRAREEERAENLRFQQRLPFGRSRFWTPPEERSLIPSTWPALEYALRKWGIGAPRSLGWR